MKIIPTIFLPAFLSLLFPFLVNAQISNDQSVIPIPVKEVYAGSSFQLHRNTSLLFNAAKLSNEAALLRLFIQQELPGKKGKNTLKTTSNSILLETDSVQVKAPEGYTLSITSKQVRITGHDNAGVLYGIQTLRQLWKPAPGKKELILPGCSLSDYPRFQYRGMALDVSRHLFPVSFIKKYIDLLSFYKFNTFHWHLTDDQGWRIEIKKYPQLQAVAAWRKETIIGHKKNSPHRFDGKPYGGYYTQEQIRDVVHYATQRNIQVIPEIEMPGHALAALAAYPNLGCTEGPYNTATMWGVFDDVFCAGNDSTFIFLENVLAEVMYLFPSRYIHIGGDECPKTRWKQCGKCQQRMKHLLIKEENNLQNYFVQRIAQFLKKHQRTIIGWDEITEGSLETDAVVMSWRGENTGIAAAERKHKVVLTPEDFLYFDHYQSLLPHEPTAAGGFTPLKETYQYDPLAKIKDNKTKEYILGVEGQAWSEYFTSTRLAEYMIFPRCMALTELAWSQQEKKIFPDFLRRLQVHSFKQQPYPLVYGTTYDEIELQSFTQDGKIWVNFQSLYPGATIKYTLNGSLPNKTSRSFYTPFSLPANNQVKARMFSKNNQPMGAALTQEFVFHQGIDASVTLKNEPMERFSNLPKTLVNGRKGNSNYNNNQWIGFHGTNLEAIIDLGSVQTIEHIGLNYLHYPWQKMWAPVSITFDVAEDTTIYKRVYKLAPIPTNGINQVQANFTPVKARYIKITGANKGIIPPGAYGAGEKALLLIDEIIVR